MWRKCGVVLSNLPCQITKWGQFKDSKWSRHKIETFWGAREIFGHFKWHEWQRGPFWGQKRFCARDHFESLNWPHLVIWQGCFHKTKPHLQHSCIGIFMQTVLNSLLRPLFLVFGLLYPPSCPIFEFYRVPVGTVYLYVQCWFISKKSISIT